MRARAEDRIRTLKDTGLSNLPLQAFAKNKIWLELAALAYELLTWTQLLAWPDHPARSWEPKRLRLRLLSVAGRLITTGRRHILRLSRRWPWSELLMRSPVRDVFSRAITGDGQDGMVVLNETMATFENASAATSFVSQVNGEWGAVRANR